MINLLSLLAVLAIPAGEPYQAALMGPTTPTGFLELEAGAPPAELVIDFKNDVGADALGQLAKSTGLAIRFNSEFSASMERLAKVPVADLAAIDRLLALFKGRDDVEQVEPNYVYRAFFAPDDPYYKHQWHMDMIHMADAWGRARGRGVVVAVIDTGVSSGDGSLKPVEDLADARFVAGYDFVHDQPYADDDHAHGTHVAGTVAQVTDNGKGVTGVAFAAKIMPIKVLNRGGSGYISDIAEGIAWATDHGADVINMSLGGPGRSIVLEKAVDDARRRGVVVVCAAGNGGGKGVGYPAAYDSAIAVSAMGPDRKLAYYSSWGPQVDIAAPGGDTRVDLNQDGIPDGVLQNTIVPGDPSRQGYFPFNGTSMASPHVAGVAALVIGQGITDPDAVERVLKKTAAPVGDADHYGAGLLDADAATSRVVWRPGLLRLGLAIAFALFTAILARRKQALAPQPVGPAFAIALIASACGLFFLRFVETWAWWLFFLTRPLAEWPGVLLGMNWHLNAAVGSVALPFVLVVLFASSRRLRPLASGFAIGSAAYLLACAIDGSVNVRWVPGHGLLDTLWLAGNGLLALVIGRFSLPKR
ncbi:MAG: peptidase S8 [Deltaproteobacteria bacterium]|nr:peptidase S8 [Deltaproteobacteria bacterium]